MNIELINPTDRANWLALRHKDVTASVIAALFGEHPYKTALELYVEKDNPEPPPEFDDVVLRRGRILELAVAKAAEEELGIALVKNDAYFRCPDLRIGATPDYKDAGKPGDQSVPWQLKTVDPAVYARDWVDDEPPLWIQLQALTEAILTEAPHAYIGALVLSRDYPFKHFKVERNTTAEAAILKAVADFWQMIADKQMPPANYGRDGATIRALYPKADKTIEVDLTRHNRIGLLCEEKLSWNKRKANAMAALETIDAEIEDVLKEAERALHPDFTITWKNEPRKGFTVEPSSPRVLRVRRKGKKEDDE